MNYKLSETWKKKKIEGYLVKDDGKRHLENFIIISGNSPKTTKRTKYTHSISEKHVPVNIYSSNYPKTLEYLQELD